MLGNKTTGIVRNPIRATPIPKSEGLTPPKSKAFSFDFGSAKNQQLLADLGAAFAAGSNNPTIQGLAKAAQVSTARAREEEVDAETVKLARAFAEDPTAEIPDGVTASSLKNALAIAADANALAISEAQSRFAPTVLEEQAKQAPFQTTIAGEQAQQAGFTTDQQARANRLGELFDEPLARAKVDSAQAQARGAKITADVAERFGMEEAATALAGRKLSNVNLQTEIDNAPVRREILEAQRDIARVNAQFAPEEKKAQLRLDLTTLDKAIKEHNFYSETMGARKDLLETEAKIAKSTVNDKIEVAQLSAKAQALQNEILREEVNQLKLNPDTNLKQLPNSTVELIAETALARIVNQTPGLELARFPFTDRVDIGGTLKQLDDEQYQQFLNFVNESESAMRRGEGFAESLGGVQVQNPPFAVSPPSTRFPVNDAPPVATPNPTSIRPPGYTPPSASEVPEKIRPFYDEATGVVNVNGNRGLYIPGQGIRKY